MNDPTLYCLMKLKRGGHLRSSDKFYLEAILEFCIHLFNKDIEAGNIRIIHGQKGNRFEDHRFTGRWSYG